MNTVRLSSWLVTQTGMTDTYWQITLDSTLLFLYRFFWIRWRFLRSRWVWFSKNSDFRTMTHFCENFQRHWETGIFLTQALSNFLYADWRPANSINFAFHILLLSGSCQKSMWKFLSQTIDIDTVFSLKFIAYLTVEGSSSKFESLFNL